MAAGDYNTEVEVALSANHHWRCDDSGTPLVDTPGTINLGVVGSPTFLVAGAVPSDTDVKAVTFDGTTDYAQATASSMSFATGSVGILFRIASGETSNNVPFELDSTGSGDGSQIRIGDTVFRFDVTQNFSNNYGETVTGLNLEDGNWHLAVVVQAGGGVGFLTYIDGALKSSSRSLSGTGTVNDFFDDSVSAGADKVAIGARAESGHTSKWNGSIASVFTTTTVMSQAQVTSLWNIVNAAGPSGKGTRRRGRRVFSDTL